MTANYFFTSDLHFYHDNVIQYSNRPFKDVTEMNEALIANWNSVVKTTDVIYVLGDVALCKPDLATSIVKRLNGTKHLLFGNHDKNLRKNSDFLALWASAQDYKEIKIHKQPIALMHYQMNVWNCSHHGSWHLHGHCHGEGEHITNSLDVGVDVWNYTPVSFDEIKETITQPVITILEVGN